MNKAFNKIALKFLSSIHISQEKKSSINEVTNLQISLFNLELSYLGYQLDKLVTDQLYTFSIKELNDLKTDVLTVLSESLGSNKKNIPLFKNFPYEIPDPSEYFEDRVNGLISQSGLPNKNAYKLDCGHAILPSIFDLSKFGACPICQKVDTSLQTSTDLPELSQVVKPNILSIASDSDVYALFKKLVNAKTNLSEDFKSVIKDVFNEKGASIKGLLPRTIEIKENAAFVSSLMVNIKGSDHYIDSYLKTATDVLRFASACSGGDISLSEKTVYKLNKKEKRKVLFLLNKINNPLEDLKRYRQEWLILSKLIHIGAFKESYPKAFEVITVLRNDEKSIKTFESDVEELAYKITQQKTETKEDLRMKNNLCFDLVSLLSSRSGVFARRLDFILRNASESAQYIIALEFIDVMDEASNNVLLSLKKMLENRNEMKYRIFMPKGSALKMRRGSASEGVISHSVVNLICSEITKLVSTRFLEKGTFENVYIDPNITKIIVPFAMRSNSSGAPAMTRGSRIALDKDCDVVRFFAQWHNVDNSIKGNESIVDRVDLDLSAVIFNADFNYLSSVYYGNREKGDDFYYSGDIQSGEGENGGFEAIDIKIDKLKAKKNARYVVMCLNSFCHQRFSSFECSAGFMERTELGGGQPFEAKTVKNRFSLDGENTQGIPLIIDLVTKEVIWVDIQDNNLNVRNNNVVENRFTIAETLKAFSEFEKFKMTMLELIDLHKPRFANIDYVKNKDVKYDLELDIDFARDLPEVVANWI